MEGKLLVIKEIKPSSHKTAEFVSILRKLELENKKITLLVSGFDKNLDKATRNLSNVNMVDAAKVSTYDLIDCETLVLDEASISVLTKILAV